MCRVINKTQHQNEAIIPFFTDVVLAPAGQTSLCELEFLKGAFVRSNFRTSAYSTIRQKGGDTHEEAFHKYGDTYCIRFKEGCSRIQNNQNKEAEKDREIRISDTEETKSLTAITWISVQK